MKKFVTKISLRNLIIIVVSLLLIVSIYRVANKRSVVNQPVFSPRIMLDSLWYYYKKENLEVGTLRALDKEQNFITTSEGQSYTMLRSVWIDDRATFDTTWQWTKDNLQHKDDHLFAWKFGQKTDGTYGILTEESGNTSASDADVDIALSLLFASKRWNNDIYFGDAILIIKDIWAKEVFTIKGRPFLAANDLEKFNTEKDTIIINPSYFAPYAFRIFEEVDPENDWAELVDSSYTLIEDNIALPLDTEKSAGIPSDWLSIHEETGVLTAVEGSTTLKTHYSYDALRLPWRLALDAKWFDEPRAKKILNDMTFFAREWNTRNHIYANYSHAGEIVEWLENPAMYGGIIGQLMYHDETIARDVYYKKLESLYNADTFNWGSNLGYYDKNWAWFGIALYNDFLPQLYPLQKIINTNTTN